MQGLYIVIVLYCMGLLCYALVFLRFAVMFLCYGLVCCVLVYAMR
nr:MAG TPA: hypothetical protein [Caudoviricetes sp.]